VVIKRYQVILIILLLIPNQIALADQECLDKTCVDVFTENNQLIITASKNGAKATPTKAKPKAAPAKKVSATSLSDRLIKLVPVGDINFQPENDALVNMPVYFWTKTPQHFHTVVPILNLVVYVNLYSTFTWSFGDGKVFTTTNQGGSYPIGLITNTYQSNGNYPVSLKITWRGTWSVNGVTTPISGNAITQSVTRQISVLNAVGRFTR
jgi:hypothetical protein